MIGDPADATGFHLVLTRDPAHESPEPLTNFLDNVGSAVLGAKNVMDI